MKIWEVECSRLKDQQEQKGVNDKFKECEEKINVLRREKSMQILYE